MSRRTRSLIKGISVIIAGISFLLFMNILNIPALQPYTYWILFVAFGLTLLVSR